ncbi:hypothetical protein ACFWIB_40870 [Streptomyces sp. NPDC127051]|uniref:hypothetical protein n=1 Tax=Streptomyces sp. NPDC127051 TaxID=3347119 RepID=UPI00364E2D1B
MNSDIPGVGLFNGRDPSDAYEKTGTLKYSDQSDWHKFLNSKREEGFEARAWGELYKMKKVPVGYELLDLFGKYQPLPTGSDEDYRYGRHFLDANDRPSKITQLIVPWGETDNPKAVAWNHAIKSGGGNYKVGRGSASITVYPKQQIHLLYSGDTFKRALNDPTTTFFHELTHGGHDLTALTNEEGYDSGAKTKYLAINGRTKQLEPAPREVPSEEAWVKGLHRQTRVIYDSRKPLNSPYSMEFYENNIDVRGGIADESGPFDEVLDKIHAQRAESSQKFYLDHAKPYTDLAGRSYPGMEQVDYTNFIEAGKKMSNLTEFDYAVSAGVPFSNVYGTEHIVLTRTGADPEYHYGFDEHGNFGRWGPDRNFIPSGDNNKYYLYYDLKSSSAAYTPEDLRNPDAENGPFVRKTAPYTGPKPCAYYASCVTQWGKKVSAAEYAAAAAKLRRVADAAKRLRDELEALKAKKNSATTFEKADYVLDSMDSDERFLREDADLVQLIKKDVDYISNVLPDGKPPADVRSREESIATAMNRRNALHLKKADATILKMAKAGVKFGNAGFPVPRGVSNLLTGASRNSGNAVTGHQEKIGLRRLLGIRTGDTEGGRLVGGPKAISVTRQQMDDAKAANDSLKADKDFMNSLGAPPASDDLAGQVEYGRKLGQKMGQQSGALAGKGLHVAGNGLVMLGAQCALAIPEISKVVGNEKATNEEKTLAGLACTPGGADVYKAIKQGQAGDYANAVLSGLRFVTTVGCFVPSPAEPALCLASIFLSFISLEGPQVVQKDGRCDLGKTAVFCEGDIKKLGSAWTSRNTQDLASISQPFVNSQVGCRPSCDGSFPGA